MKKTEKIEVRLSHEEKTSLTELAEQEGRSVSDLVRGLIERYVSINTSRLPNKTPWMLISAIAFGSFFAGHLMTYFIAKSYHPTPIYDLRVEVDRDGISFPLLEKEGKPPELTIPSIDGDILIRPTIEARPESLAIVTVELCRETKTSCEGIAAPKLQFNPNRQSSIRFKSGSGQDVFITLHKPKSRE